MTFLRFDVPLLPFIEKRQEHEIKRASRARTDRKKKVKLIKPRFPSTNTMYPVRQAGGKYLSDEGRLWKDYVKETLDHQFSTYPPWDMYYVTYVFFMSPKMMYTKAGDLANHDVSNFLKGTEDAVFEWLVESDKQVTGIQGYKRVATLDPKLVVLISESTEKDVLFHREHVFAPEELELVEKSFSSSL